MSEKLSEYINRYFIGHEDVTENLKASDQMEWVQRMNSIRERVEETTSQELIYT